MTPITDSSLSAEALAQAGPDERLKIAGIRHFDELGWG